MAYITGDRRIPGATSSGISFGAGNVAVLTNGIELDAAWWSGTVSGSCIIKWDFGSGKAYTVTEFLFVQDLTTSHGTWKIQGSNDDSAWTDIGSSFTLGGAARQAITAPAANTTAYRYYRLLGVSGSMSSAPWLRELRPSVGTDVTWIITNALGVNSGSCFNFNFGYPELVDGTINDEIWFSITGGGVVDSGNWVKFDFGRAAIVTEVKWYQSGAQAQGTRKWQGSNDDSGWTDIGSSFALSNATETITTMSANTTGYRWYRMIGVSGTQSNSTFQRQVEFDMTYAGGGGGAARCAAMNRTQQGMQ